MNSLQFGFRGREYPATKPEGVFRIMLVGDSMVFGHGVSPDQTLSAHMERLLNQHRNEAFYHVINCSRPGYSLMDTSILYTQTAHRFNADVVVIILSNNDAEVVGTVDPTEYGDHCRSIWQESAPSYPFFLQAFHTFRKELRDTPCMIAYYGLSNDTVAGQASSVVADLCRQHAIPFLNLQKAVTWIPFHRAVASKADGHPSGHAHRVAATELCRALITENFLPAADQLTRPEGPDLSATGVSREWATEEMRAWCLARQDGKGKEAARALLRSRWPECAQKTYRERQKRIMARWWQEIQNHQAFDWRYYREHFLNISKGIAILQKNQQDGKKIFLTSDAFFRDRFPEPSVSLSEIKATLTAITALGEEKRPSFLEIWLPQAVWACNTLIALQKNLAELPCSHPSLEEARLKLMNRFNHACNAFCHGMKLLGWEDYLTGFSNLPVRLTDKPFVEIRACVQAPENGYLGILCKGKGEISSFLHDGLYIHGEEDPQYLLFKYPLADLFSCEFRLTGSGSKYLGIEYRVNRSNWRVLDFVAPPKGNHTDTTLQTLLRPAFC